MHTHRLHLLIIVVGAAVLVSLMMAQQTHFVTLDKSSASQMTHNNNKTEEMQTQTLTYTEYFSVEKKKLRLQNETNK